MPAINPSMNATTLPDALYYPFHLCHPGTLELMLGRYATVHFRDYMAIQLTPLTGTTAYQDRMGDQFPDFVRAGRIVQGYHVSGPLTGELAEAVDRDLSDFTWRTKFHQALSEDRRFQRGLFDVAHSMLIGRRLVPGPAVLLTLLDARWPTQALTLEDVRRLSRSAASLEEAYAYEYGLAMVKTSAALRVTYQLAQAHLLRPVTDSRAHHDLFVYSLARERLLLAHDLLPRVG
jgi:hypothetical protein